MTEKEKERLAFARRSEHNEGTNFIDNSTTVHGLRNED